MKLLQEGRTTKGNYGGTTTKEGRTLLKGPKKREQSRDHQGKEIRTSSLSRGGGIGQGRGWAGWSTLVSNTLKDIFLLGNMAGAGTGQLVGVDEESPVGVAGVHRQHPVVHVLLGALALVAGDQEAAGRVGVVARLQPGGLGVVVLAVAVALGDVLQ